MAASVLMGLTFLVIGDSHIANPAYLMNFFPEQLVAHGAKVHSLGVCGAMPADWVKASPAGSCGGGERVDINPPTLLNKDAMTVGIGDLVAKERPSVIVVVFGDTLGAYNNPEFPKAWAYQQVTKLTTTLKKAGVACYWVGPGWSNIPGRFNKTNERVKIVNNFLAENVSPCTYIDSTKFSQPGDWKTMDGQHYTSTGNKKWAQAIGDVIVEDVARKAK